jgi:hypothetical protein
MNCPRMRMMTKKTVEVMKSVALAWFMKISVHPSLAITMNTESKEFSGVLKFDFGKVPLSVKSSLC